MDILKKVTQNHRIITEDGVEFNLYIVTNYDFGSDYSIIKIESATGDGGVSYNNGRMIENIPISGTLMANSLKELNELSQQLRQIADRKEVVDFIYPFKTNIRTNKFYIENIRLTPMTGKDTEINFSLTLVEKRDTNVKTTQVNLSNYAQSEALKALVEQRLVGVE